MAEVNSSERKDGPTDGGDPFQATLTIIASFDLGGSFADTSMVTAALRRESGFGDACASTVLSERLQASYRFSHEASVVAARERPYLALPSWQGTAWHDITVHPAGVISHSLKLDNVPPNPVVWAQIEDEFYSANAVHYRPYLKSAYASDRQAYEGLSGSAGDGGLNLVTPTETIRSLLADVIRARPQTYPPVDARIAVTVVQPSFSSPDVDELVSRYKKSRVGSLEAQTYSTFKPVTRSVDARAWEGVVLVSCDEDAWLVVTDTSDRAQAAVECLEAAQQTWLLARTWVGVLDRIGTFDIEAAELDAMALRALERRVVVLSSLELEIATSMVIVDATSVMLRDAWRAEVVEAGLRTLRVDVQRRLVEQRLAAVDRNHKTVAEILDRAHQKAARSQADRLQVLFSGAVAATITALIPATAQLEGPNAGALAAITWVATIVAWTLFAAAVLALGRFKIGLGESDE